MRIDRLDEDLELEFIREFSVGGTVLKGLSLPDRSERIRVAIYAHKLVDKPFRDTGMDYAGAFRACYGRPIEMRRTPRGAPQHQASQNSVADIHGLSEQDDGD
jgi:hypothetical protein